MRGKKPEAEASSRGYTNSTGEAVYRIDHKGEETWYTFAMSAVKTWEELSREAKEPGDKPVLLVGRSPNSMKRIR